MDYKSQEKNRISYFSNVKTRLGPRLPAGPVVPSPHSSPRGPSRPLSLGSHLQQPRPRHHVPHIRNPQLRQYYLKETPWISEGPHTAPSVLASPPDRIANGDTVRPVDTVYSVASQCSPTPVTAHQTMEQPSHVPDLASPVPLLGVDPAPAPTPVPSSVPSMSLASPSLDAEYDKLLDVEAVPMPDGQLCLLALPPECSEGEGPAAMPYLKLCCRYVTDRKGVVTGVLLVTPNKIFFDPYKSQLLVLEHGCEEYLLSCSVDSLESVSFCSDISHVHFSTTPQRMKARRMETPLKIPMNLAKKLRREKRARPVNQKGDVAPSLPSSAVPNLGTTLGPSRQPATESQGTWEEEEESEDMAEAERQLEGPVNELAVQSAGMLSSAATFCCGGLEAAERGSSEPGTAGGTEMQRGTRRGTLASQASGDSAGLMFLRLRLCSPQTSSRSTSKPARVKDAWFALSHESSDELYAYLSHWRPDVGILEGCEEEEEEEFVLVDNGEQEVPWSEGRPGDEWEMVTVEEGGGRSLVLDREPEGLGDIVEQSRILKADHVRQISGRLPPRTVGRVWQLTYSTWRHGASLRSLYRKLAGSDSPTLLIIKDSESQVFGAFLSHPLRPSETFYGTGETFLFTLDPTFECFSWTGENSFFIKGDVDSFAIGGGSGHFGLWLDESLYTGNSRPCYTFNNRCLSGTDDFHVLEMEVWTFG